MVLRAWARVCFAFVSTFAARTARGFPSYWFVFRFDFTLFVAPLVLRLNGDDEMMGGGRGEKRGVYS